MNIKLWTDEAVITLRTMHQEGYSYSQIAREIGNGCTRSSVSGKVDRLGLGTRVARSERMTRPRIPKTVVVPEVPPVDLSIEPEAFILAGGAHVTVLTVNDRMCRWPFGDPQEVDFHFCGHSPRSGSPYCEAHARKAFQPASVIKRSYDAP